MATRTLTLNAEYSAYDIGGIFDTTSPYVTIQGRPSDPSGHLYIQFEKIPESLKNLQIRSATLHLYMADAAAEHFGTAYAALFFLRSPLDIANGVYTAGFSDSYISRGIDSISYATYDINLAPAYATLYIENGLAITRNNILYIKTATATSTHKPNITLTYDTGSVIAEPIGPKGFVDRHQPITFSWRPTWSGFPTETITQTSATLTIRYYIVDDGFHELTYNISGNSTAYTIPANTIPISSVDSWYVTVNTAFGSGSSPHTYFDVLDGTPTATAVSPNGIYVDGSAPVRFVWTHSTSTGTPQSAYDLQYLHNGTWTTLHSASTADQFYEAPAETFDSGAQSWRVRTYNADGLVGEWSNELQFISIRSPDPPQVTVTSAVPFAQIRWTASDQQAYEIKTGTTNTGIIYGTEKNYTFPQPLDDGLTTVSTRVMNIYGLWSPWGSATANIVNTPGTAPTLTADAGEEASLSWTAVSLSSEYWVYRNNTLIARTTELTYIDRTVSGLAVYRVRAIMSDGQNYTDSNAVTVTVTIDHPSVFALDGTATVDLSYSMSSAPTITTSLARDISFMQYNNTTLPTAEASPFKSRLVTIAPAFASASEASNFERLIGKLVCYRDQYGTNIIGVMSAMSKTQSVFFASYTTTITEVDPADYEIY